VYRIEEVFLRKCVESLIAVEGTPVEIILVDDGSPDHCGVICDEYRDKDKRVRVIHQENQGVSVARNRGIEESRGKWIMFVDADDYVDVDYYSKLEPRIDHECDLMLFPYYRNDKPKDCSYCAKMVVDFNLASLLNSTIIPKKYRTINNVFGTPWTKLFSKKNLLTTEIRFLVGLEKRQDQVFMVSILSRQPHCEYVDVPYYHYRYRATSVCRSYKADTLEWSMRFLDSLDAAVGLDEERKKRVLGAAQLHLLAHECSTLYVFHKDNPKPKSDVYLEIDQYIKSPKVRKNIAQLSFKEKLTVGYVVYLAYLLHMYGIMRLMYLLRIGINKRRNAI
jgi:glycosyltransferase involved in cell wall biosynthesis